MRQPGKPINDFKKERKKKKEKEIKKERNYLSNAFLCKLKEQTFLLSLSSVKFVNDFDDSIIFHSVNFHLNTCAGRQLKMCIVTIDKLLQTCTLKSL